MLLVIDNYDSLIGNRAKYFGNHGEDVGVLHNNAIARLAPDRIFLPPPRTGWPMAGSRFISSSDLPSRSRRSASALAHQPTDAAIGVNLMQAQQITHGTVSKIVPLNVSDAL